MQSSAPTTSKYTFFSHILNYKNSTNFKITILIVHFVITVLLNWKLVSKDIFETPKIHTIQNYMSNNLQ